MLPETIVSKSLKLTFKLLTAFYK